MNLSNKYVFELETDIKKNLTKLNSSKNRDRIDFENKGKQFLDDLCNPLNKIIFNSLITCPTCFSVSSEIEYRDDFEIEVKCNVSNCSTIWGLKYCRNCHKRTFYKKIQNFDKIINNTKAM